MNKEASRSMPPVANSNHESIMNEDVLAAITPPSTAKENTAKKRKHDDDKYISSFLHGGRHSPSSSLWDPSGTRSSSPKNETKRKLDLDGAATTPEAGARPVSLPHDDNRSTCSSSSKLSQATPQSQAMTQPVNYSQDLKAGLNDPDKNLPTLIATLTDWNDTIADKQRKTFDISKSCVTLGRSKGCDIQTQNEAVGRTHCSLTFCEMDGTCYLKALPTSNQSLKGDPRCWVQPLDSKEWTEVMEDQRVRIRDYQRFRVQRPGEHPSANRPGAEFVLSIKVRAEDVKAGYPSHAFDVQYLKLVRAIQNEGVEQKNKKGSSSTLPLSCELRIPLTDTSGKDRNLLPLTSLRSLYGGGSALVEALWYLRGEDNITFLQNNRCPFWDKQAVPKGGVNWVGLNYGLLTNFPQADGKSINQLEKNVIQVLCKPKSCSRNMVCTLIKPGEDNVQGACTSSIQFSVSTLKESGSTREMLNVTVTQRSSDVMIGLPHDVTVWSIILHLVRREVLRRTGRNLIAGNLFFAISQNAAHVYATNSENMKQILTRKPKEFYQPQLVIDKNLDSKNIFELAKIYVRPPKETPNQTGIYTQDYENCHPVIKMAQAL